MRNKDEEHRSQAALIAWASMQSAVVPELELLYAVPNGGHRDIRTASRLKNEGVKRGVPDLCLPVPRGVYHGLYIEMKSSAGKLSAEQRWWRDRLVAQGFAHVVSRSAGQAAGAISDYLAGVDVMR